MFNHAGVCIQVSVSVSLSVCLLLFFWRARMKATKTVSIHQTCAREKCGKSPTPCGEGGLVKIRAGALLRLLRGVMKARQQAKGVKDMQILTEFTLSTLID